jgi:hypothetical protein
MPWARWLWVYLPVAVVGIGAGAIIGWWYGGREDLDDPGILERG